jgi:DnaJ-class molecular chaperone
VCGRGDVTAYEVLGVAEAAPQREVARAFHRAVLRHHPDRAGDAEALRFVCRAHALVGEPEARAAYDRRLRAQRAERAGARSEARIDLRQVAEVARVALEILRVLKRS